MKILLSRHAGFCFGVRRAVELLEQGISRKDRRIFTLGHIIHNEDFNESLEKRGVRCIGEEEIESLSPETDLVFIRTHGVPRDLVSRLEESGVPFVDATCPNVKKIHDIVKSEEELARESGEEIAFVLLGDPVHPEVLGIVSEAKRYPVTVVNGPEDLITYEETAQKNIRHVFLSQTTHSLSAWEACVAEARRFFPDTTFYDTICGVTGTRQRDAVQIARQSDLMVVVGGKSSSNTQKLVSAAKEFCQTVHIRKAAELPRELLRKEMTVGVTAGASTPDSMIKEVMDTMTENNQEMSFEEMLNESFRTIRTGEEVTGTVTSVFANEIHVDLGIKHTGILPASEVADSEQDLAENFHPGDEITVLVQKFNDAEGTVQVSKKRVDSRADWSKVTEAYESGAVLTGKVTAVIKGGILVTEENQTYFIPASLTGVPKGGSLDPLMGTEVSFKVIEVDPSRKRAVASIREVLKEQRKEIEDAFWAQVAVDQVYTGKVKSITSYGAFVDLGGVDGMVHITELSWKKLKSPAEVVKVGDEITVYVKGIDPETRKISLGYKTEATNPWNLIRDQYQPGDVATVKIVGLTSFGAFAELIPGIDGLIHISQLSNHKVATPADVVKVGDEVQVEVVDINYETRRVSLSMRALMEDEEEEAPAEEAPAEEAKEEAPVEEAPAEEAKEEAPVEEAPAEEAKEEAPVEEAPAEEAKEEAPAEEAKEEAPAEEAPAEEAVKKAPAKRTRKKKEPVEEAPAEEAPAAEEKE